MRGAVESKNAKKDSAPGARSTFGFIRGEDGRSYFFIPTGMQQTSMKDFDALLLGDRVDFTPIDGGLGRDGKPRVRAIEVAYVGPAEVRGSGPAANPVVRG